MNKFSVGFYSYLSCFIIYISSCLCHGFYDCEYPEIHRPYVFAARNDGFCRYPCSDLRTLPEKDCFYDDHHYICHDVRPFEKSECRVPGVCNRFKRYLYYVKPEIPRCESCFHDCPCECLPERDEVRHELIVHQDGTEEECDSIKKSYCQKEKSVCYTHGHRNCASTHNHCCRPSSSIRYIPCRRTSSFI